MAAVRCGAVLRCAVRRGGRVENRHHYCDQGRSGGGGERRAQPREVSTADSSRAGAQCVARRTDAANLSVLARARSRRSLLPVACPSGSPQDTPLIGACAIWSCTGCSRPSELSFTSIGIAFLVNEKVVTSIPLKLYFCALRAKVYFRSREYFCIYLLSLVNWIQLKIETGLTFI